MRQILSDIRALSGVTGVAVIAKRTGKIDHFFPAAFTDRHTQFLRELITSTYQRLRGFTRLALRFERVVVHLYNQPEYLLFVTTLPDTDTRQFEMVVNSKFGSIARELVNSGNAMVPGTTTVSPMRPTTVAQSPTPSTIPGPARPKVDDAIVRLMTACNSLTDQMAESRGRLRLSNDWRKARDLANGTSGVLDPIMVDAAGRLQMRKGQSLPTTAVVMSAFAVMIDSFFETLDTQRTMAEEEFYMLLRPHRALLEPAGFFMYLDQQQSRGRVAR
jgi:hypothetical protein